MMGLYEGVVSFGVQELYNLLKQEGSQFLGVEDQVNDLRRGLNYLNSFIQDAEAKKSKMRVVRNCVNDIKEILCDAEDTTETFVLKEKLRKTNGIMRIIRLPRVILDRREIALEIEGLSKRINSVISEMKNVGVLNDVGYVQPLHNRQMEMNEMFAMDHESNLVGLEANVEELVGHLVEKNNIQKVSITGMVGVGKTTLARQVYNHQKVKDEFGGQLAWVYVSQDFTCIRVWKDILTNLSPKEDEHRISQLTSATLQGELYQLLDSSKSLIVLDDIWEIDHWRLLERAFPRKKDCKMLLTSRNESVAVRGDPTYFNFKCKRLSIEECCTLLRMIVPMEDAPDEMKEMGNKMVEHCGGFPWAVKVLGSLLAAKYTPHDWKRISENTQSHIMGGTNFIGDVLSLIFEELPGYLKHCFLYLAHFPEDYAINVEKLSYYWATERIPKPRGREEASIRDVADIYINELVMRNMVIAERDVTTLRFETLHLNAIVRKFCLDKAKEENFVQINGILSPSTDYQSPYTTRRLVLHYPTTLHVKRDIKYPRLRSLLALSNMRGLNWQLTGLRFTRLQLLRLLDLSGARFEGGKVPSSIGELIHLRYLSLEKARVSHLPSSLRYLKLLIYFNLEIFWDSVIYVPNFLKGMQELRYLALPFSMHRNTELDLSNLKNLETLKNFSTGNCSFGDLYGLEMLRTIEISFYPGMSVETLSSSFGRLGHLENLTLIDCRSNGFDPNIREGFVLDCIHLNKLELRIYMPRLPEQQHFPSHLTTITLTECCLEEDPMPILEKLIQLKEVILRVRAFSRSKMVCSKGRFLQLHKLELSGLPAWEEWIVEDGSMPLLHTLEIHQCGMLKELPDGMQYIRSLKDLIMGKEWRERLSVGGNDYYKVRHIPSVRF